MAHTLYLRNSDELLLRTGLGSRPMSDDRRVLGPAFESGFRPTAPADRPSRAHVGVGTSPAVRTHRPRRGVSVAPHRRGPSLGAPAPIRGQRHISSRQFDDVPTSTLILAGLVLAVLAFLAVAYGTPTYL